MPVMLPNLRSANEGLAKSPTGIRGFDDITGGGLPQDRTTLICGGPGSGKTLFAIEYLINGIQEFNEPGVLIAFEETRDDLIRNCASLGFDLAHLIEQGKLIIDEIVMDTHHAQQTGDYDLEGLFIRLEYAINKVNAKRIAIDTIEVIFDLLGNSARLRSELRRLFRWIKEKKVTTVITSESEKGLFTRHDIEPYVSDCVIFLDQRLQDQLARRRLRIVKYRGSLHGTDEYPFLIDQDGMSVLPITSVGLDYTSSEERVATGIAGLDKMLGGEGYFRGSTILVSGSSGTGKTSFAAHFVNAACQRGEHCIYFTFEESASQILRNMRSIGIDLRPWMSGNLLQIHAIRPTMYNLEIHLAMMQKLIQDFQSETIVVDPVTSFDLIGNTTDISLLFTRLIDFCKMRGITTLVTSIITSSPGSVIKETNLSSLVDTWISLQDIEVGGERNRVLYVLKSRGMKHSKQISEFEFSSDGIYLIDAYTDSEGMLTGSARLAREMRKELEELEFQQQIAIKRLKFENRQAALKAQIEALQAELRMESAELQLIEDQTARRNTVIQHQRNDLARKHGV
ncbi:MAG: circadian clock protein KaiC [Anaerolineae bacterium]|nr:circadian clock protein KaiC [Anaerolineae bacterium]